MPCIHYVEKLTDDIKIKMETDLVAYEAEHEIDVNYKLFALILKDDNGGVIGILMAHTAFAEIYIRDIWVDEHHQHKGYGRQLIQKLENLFTGRGFNNINLVTCEYQAPSFYKKCDYTLEYIRNNPKNPKLNLYFFVKFFDGTWKSEVSSDLSNIEYIDKPTDELTKTIEAGLKKHEDKHGIDVNHKAFALVLVDDNKEVIGVLNAFHSYSSIYIDDIWIDSCHRRKGYGRQLIQELETQFKGKGFYHINLVTSEFQAPQFYSKCGFTLEFVRKNLNNPEAQQIHFFQILLT